MQDKWVVPSIRAVMTVSEPIAAWAEEIAKVVHIDPSVVLNAMLMYAYKEVRDEDGNLLTDNFAKLAVDIAILSQAAPFKRKHKNAN